MTSKLNDQLRLLAGLAGEYDNYHRWSAIAASGQLDTADVGLVLSWLAKAGYVHAHAYYPESKAHGFIQFTGSAEIERKRADTLEQALTEAVMKLELEGRNDE